MVFRAAAQQRRRTEIAAEEATAILRRAAEAQRVLRHEVLQALLQTCTVLDGVNDNFRLLFC